MAEEEAEGGSILTSPLAMLAGGIVGIVILAYVVSSVLPGILSPPSMPGSPTGLVAESISGGIKLSWQPPAFSPEKYVVYKSTESGVLGNKAGEVPGSMTSYIDLQVAPGSTYYYAVHSVSGANEEQNAKQASASYQASGETAPPSSVGLKISSGNAHVNSRDVVLSVSAINAEECRFKNENSEWSAWEPFSPTVQWQLTVGDRAKEVSVQCRNPAEVESSPVSAQVVLDTVAPVINVSKSGRMAGTRKFNLTFSATDSASPTLSCKGYVNGLESGISAKPGERTSVIFNGLATKNTVYAKCTDLAGNSAETAKYSFDVEASLLQNGTRIKINGDMAETRSVSVDLSLFSQDAYECRLKNSGEDFIGWEPYRTTRGWTLSYGNGHKTVYYQCRDINGQFVGEAQDDIILIRSNDGSRGGGGGDSGSSGGGVGGSGGDESGGVDIGGSTAITTGPPSNLSIVINNGDVYTNSYDVSLSLYAINAQECRFKSKESGGNFGAWEPYASSRNFRFQLSTQNGVHTVVYECRNQAVAIDQEGYPSAEDSIVYDGSTPDAPTHVAAKALPGGSMELSWEGDFPMYRLDGSLPSPVSNYNIYRREHIDALQQNSISGAITGAMGNFAWIVQNSVFSDYASSGEYLDPRVFYKIGEASSLSWVDSSSSTSHAPINGVSYDYIVKAEDQAGTESGESEIATATSDSMAPELTVYEPTSTGYYAGNSVTLAFKVTDNLNTINCGYQLSYMNRHTTDPDILPAGFIANIPPRQGQRIERQVAIPVQDRDYRLDLTCSDVPGNQASEPVIFHVYSPPVLEQRKKEAAQGSTSPTSLSPDYAKEPSKPIS